MSGRGDRRSRFKAIDNEDQDQISQKYPTIRLDNPVDSQDGHKKEAEAGKEADPGSCVDVVIFFQQRMKSMLIGHEEYALGGQSKATQPNYQVSEDENALEAADTRASRRRHVTSRPRSPDVASSLIPGTCLSSRLLQQDFKDRSTWAKRARLLDSGVM